MALATAAQFSDTHSSVLRLGAEISACPLSAGPLLSSSLRDDFSHSKKD
jgi:hypothetical protein